MRCIPSSGNVFLAFLFFFRNNFKLTTFNKLHENPVTTRAPKIVAVYCWPISSCSESIVQIKADRYWSLLILSFRLTTKFALVLKEFKNGVWLLVCHLLSFIVISSVSPTVCALSSISCAFILAVLTVDQYGVFASCASFSCFSRCFLYSFCFFAAICILLLYASAVFSICVERGNNKSRFFSRLLLLASALIKWFAGSLEDISLQENYGSCFD